jgi:hypothetical protein
VGNPLRQNPKTRILNIAIFRQKNVRQKGYRQKNTSDTLSLISFLFVLGFPSTNPRIWSVDVSEVLDFVASSLNRHKHEARGKKVSSLIPLQRGILGFTHKT